MVANKQTAAIAIKIILELVDVLFDFGGGLMSFEPRRAYAYLPHGQIHYAEAGIGFPLLLLHQAPRSWDEYRELIPRFAEHHHVIAMDLPGMGGSDPLPAGASIEGYADAAIALLDSLGLWSADVVGHHTGSFVALNLAACHPERVRRLVLSSAAWADAESRERLAGSESHVDNAPARDDGSHLVQLWSIRQAFYPPNRTDLLVRYIRDAVTASSPQEGHLACTRFDMSELPGRITAPELLLGHDADPFTFPQFPLLAAHFPAAQQVTIKGGMVPLETQTDQVAEAILAFLDAPNPQQQTSESRVMDIRAGEAEAVADCL